MKGLTPHTRYTVTVTAAGTTTTTATATYTTLAKNAPTPKIVSAVFSQGVLSVVVSAKKPISIEIATSTKRLIKKNITSSTDRTTIDIRGTKMDGQKIRTRIVDEYGRQSAWSQLIIIQ